MYVEERDHFGKLLYAAPCIAVSPLRSTVLTSHLTTRGTRGLRELPVRSRFFCRRTCPKTRRRHEGCAAVGVGNLRVSAEFHQHFHVGKIGGEAGEHKGSHPFLAELTFGSGPFGESEIDVGTMLLEESRKLQTIDST